MPNGPAAAVGLELGARAGAHTPRQRLRLRRRGDGLRRRHDPHRPRRRRRRRRHRGRHPPAADRRLRRDAGAVDPQRRPRGAPRAPTTRAATASSSARAPRVLVLESRGARRRPAARTIYAELAGVGHDRRRPPHRRTRAGGRRRLPRHARGASSGPGSTPTDIVHINAHATSTPRRRHRRVQRDPARRSATHVDDIAGHRDQVDDRAPARRRRRAGGASLTILALHHRLAPPTINLDDPDPAIPLDVVTGEPRKLPAGRHRRAEQLVRLRRPQRRPGLPQRLSA